MVSHNSSRKLPKKKIVKKSSTPKIHRDKINGIISIKLKTGIETKSYRKGGILFSENEDGEVIEIQVLS
jgi:hypothetical protein